MTSTIHQITSDVRWTVLHYRWGLGSQPSLQELANLLNVSRARVGQIEKMGARDGYAALPTLAPWYDLLELSPILWNGTRVAPIDEICSKVRNECCSLGRENISVEDAVDLITLCRALAYHFKGAFVSRWPKFSYATCALNPPVLCHPEVLREFTARQQEVKDERKPWTYARLAEFILDREQAPMHWKEIAREAEQLGMRQSFNPTPMFNSLLSHSEVFVRLDQGTYGLKKWGGTRVPYFKVLLESALHSAERSLSFGTLFSIVSEQRAAKKNSIQMYLDLDPKFYKSVDGTYGLRTWLPPPHLQTLRTPAWKIESPESAKRVRRAKMSETA